MPGQSGQSIGKDVTVILNMPSGGNLTFPVLEGWTAKPKFKDLESVGLDGIVRHDELPAGWEGTLKYKRGSSAIDAYFAQNEAAYYAGQLMGTGIIQETIQEASGSVSQFQYTGVVLKYEESGNWTGEAYVEQAIGWKASKRLQTA
jgi:hypothetical protein